MSSTSRLHEAFGSLGHRAGVGEIVSNIGAEVLGGQSPRDRAPEETNDFYAGFDEISFFMNGRSRNTK
jgi:hypothetical protein